MSRERISKIYKLLDEAKCTAIALNPSPTMTYLSGLQFSRDERPKILILGPDLEPVIILPEFEAGLLQHSNLQLKPFTYGENQETWANVFKDALQYIDIKNQCVGVEPIQMRVMELRLLEQASPSTQFISAANQIDQLRMKKDEIEIQKMIKAAQIAEEAFQALLPTIRIGVTEKEVASELVLQLLRHGSDPQIAFPPIVASGPNGANPHAHPTNRRLSPGDLVVIDWGARFEGYCSDITRTLAIGKITPENDKIAQIVADANTAGRSSASCGVKASAVDDAARTVIENAGYGPYFIHRTGHGLGLEVHENPYITRDNSLVLEEGMTFTVEPGIYIAGQAGVRIEDNVVVGENGGESLTSFPRGLIRID